MSWLFFTIFANLCSASSSIIDKFLLSRPIFTPAVYTFYIGLLSLFVLVLVPFGTVWPGIWQTAFDIGIGVIFLFALLFFFLAVNSGEISRIAPIVGGLAPIFVFILSFIFLGERLEMRQILAFLLFIIGGALISIKKDAEDGLWKTIPRRVIYFALLSAFLGSLYYVLAKTSFSSQQFVSAFVWNRLGGFLAAILFLAHRRTRRDIINSVAVLKGKIGLALLSSKALAGLGFLSLNYAIALGSATLVNAVQGTQYVFLLIFALFLSKKYPHIISEEISRAVILQKSLAILLLCLGFALLVT